MDLGDAIGALINYLHYFGGFLIIISYSILVDYTPKTLF